jgi:uncharacterized RDD family membrane protein YckC
VARSRRSLRRRFVTPEGVDLQLELGAAGSRAAAYIVDLVLMLVLLIGVTIAIGYAADGARQNAALAIVWLLGTFVLRNGWFILFEIGSRGATPGKRAMGLRVIAGDGGRLTGSAVVARNAMREVEVFLPLSFLGFQAAEGAADAFLLIFGLGWSAVFLLFPLFNRDRLRMGDIVAGTWVVRQERRRLAAGLVTASEQRSFSEAALALYGEYELQTLEEVLRANRADSLATVAATIRAKAGIADDGDDAGFLLDYYRALCGRLERQMAFGHRVADKWQRPERARTRA